MLLTNKNSSTPPIFTGRSETRPNKSLAKGFVPMAIDMVRADIAPLGNEANLLNALRKMAEQNETRGIIALFDCFVAIANTYQAIENEPRSDGVAEEYLEAECNRSWSKAYLVADFLKDQPIKDINRDEMARVLITCALQMGHGIEDVAKIAAELAELPEGFERNAEDMQPPTVAIDPWASSYD